MTSKRIIFIFIITLLLSTTTYVFADSEKPGSLDQPACGAGQFMVNEIDYAQPSDDTAEFVEVHGRSNYSLSNYEIHLVRGIDSLVYETIALTGKSVSADGYFLLASQSVIDIVAGMNAQNYVVLSTANAIDNNSPSGAGLYDVNAEAYCSFVNYGGTVPGFENWLNIGVDASESGMESGCSRMLAGWWSCNRLTTPGGPNETVAVNIVEIATNGSQWSLLLVYMLATMSLLTWREVSKRR